LSIANSNSNCRPQTEANRRADLRVNEVLTPFFEALDAEQIRLTKIAESRAFLADNDPVFQRQLEMEQEIARLRQQIAQNPPPPPAPQVIDNWHL